MNQPGILRKARSYATSLLSRGLGVLGYAGKVEEEAKRTRKASCNGLEGSLSPCPHRAPSQKIPDSFYCGACGCGDKKAVLVAGNTPDYEKLDYPHLVCPVNMPGFSNYLPSTRDDVLDDRKVFIEQMHGVQRLVQMRDDQKRIFKIQQFIEMSYAVYRDPRKIGRGLRRAFTRVFNV